MSSTFLPNEVSYLSFGASGNFVNDTIYYYGGARSEGSFGIQNGLRKGVINPDDLTEIEWSISIPDANLNGYQMASTTIGDEVHWIGGSNNTYNFDGIAYDGSGGVPPSNQVISLNTTTNTFTRVLYEDLPMDLRGIAEFSGTVKYIAGGMLSNQTVSDKVLKLEWQNESTGADYKPADNLEISIYPNPTSDSINILYQGRGTIESYTLYDFHVQVIQFGGIKNNVSVKDLPNGVYHLELKLETGKKYLEKVNIRK